MDDDFVAWWFGFVTGVITLGIVGIFVLGPNDNIEGKKQMFREIAAQRCAESGLRPMFNADKAYSYICVPPEKGVLP